MGYCSRFELSLSNVNESEARMIIKEFRDCYEYAYCCLDKEGYPEESGKWYDAQKELKEFSSKYPDILFTLKREGEEPEDIELIFAKNGKSYSDDVKFIYPEYDSTILEKYNFVLLDKYNKQIDELNKQSLDKWGQNSAYDFLIEDLSDLIVAIQHVKKGREKKTNKELATELVDAYIMLRKVISFSDSSLLEDAILTQMTRYRQCLNK